MDCFTIRRSGCTVNKMDDRELDEESIRLWAALTYGSEVLDFDVGATPIPPSTET